VCCPPAAKNADLSEKSTIKQSDCRLLAHYSPESFRVTRITKFLENDGTLKPLTASPARQIAESSSSFFTAPIRNANTRFAYYRAIRQFLAGVKYHVVRN
jgi:hypothetical protein